MATFATSDGTKKYAARFAGRAAAGHFREQQGLWLSSLGIGTYLGEADERTDRPTPMPLSPPWKRART